MILNNPGTNIFVDEIICNIFNDRIYKSPIHLFFLSLNIICYSYVECEKCKNQQPLLFNSINNELLILIYQEISKNI